MQKSQGSVFEVLKVSTRLGLTSFGGPIAHLGYFHEEYVKRRKWLDEKGYADLVALCQFLPGPASSQVGIAIGIERAGLVGGLVAWIGFTLPSAIALVIFASVLKGLNLQHAGWLHGLMIVASSFHPGRHNCLGGSGWVAVVSQGADQRWSTDACPDWT